MDVKTIQLNGTRTSACRFCSWVQVQDTFGILEVCEGPRPEKIKTRSRYLVQEVDPTYCRRFRITKEVNAGGEVYWVSLANPLEHGSDSCDCTGFESHGHCKHVDGLRALLNAGYLNPTMGYPVPAGYDPQRVIEQHP